jgi:hypothetical protein
MKIAVGEDIWEILCEILQKPQDGKPYHIKKFSTQYILKMFVP